MSFRADAPSPGLGCGWVNYCGVLFVHISLYYGMSRSSELANSWVVQVSMDKNALEERGEFVETYKLYIDGGLVDLTNEEVADNVFIIVKSVQEVNNENPGLSTRMMMFGRIQTLAPKFDFEFSGVISYDLRSRVMFEYTWVRNSLLTVDSKLARAAVRHEPSKPITVDDLLWTPGQ